MTFSLITHFDKKRDASEEMHAFRNRHEELREDEDVENIEHELTLEEEKRKD